MPIINSPLPWKESALIIKTGITAETESISTSSIPAGYPLDQSFVRLASDHVWDYAGGWSYLTLQRTAEGTITWYHLFSDIYTRINYSSMRLAAEIVLLSKKPKSIQYVSKAIDLSVDGNRQLTSALATAVNPDRARAFLNSRLAPSGCLHLSAYPYVSGANVLTWDVTTQDYPVTRTLRAVVVDP